MARTADELVSWEPCQWAGGSLGSCWLQVRGSYTQQRGKRRKLAFTPLGSCEPSDHRQSWLERPWGWCWTRRWRSWQSTFLGNRANRIPAYIRWVASRARGILKKTIMLALTHCKNHKILKCTRSWEFSNNILDFMIFLTYFIVLLRVSQQATYKLCLLTSWKKISYTFLCLAFPLQFQKPKAPFSFHCKQGAWHNHGTPGTGALRPTATCVSLLKNAQAFPPCFS